MNTLFSGAVTDESAATAHKDKFKTCQYNAFVATKVVRKENRACADNEILSRLCHGDERAHQVHISAVSR